MSKYIRYGWLRPDGTTISCDFWQHSQEARKELKKLGLSDDEIERFTCPNCQLYRRGYIHISGPDFTLTGNKNITPSQKRYLEELIDEKEYNYEECMEFLQDTQQDTPCKEREHANGPT